MANRTIGNRILPSWPLSSSAFQHLRGRSAQSERCDTVCQNQADSIPVDSTSLMPSPTTYSNIALSWSRQIIEHEKAQKEAQGKA